MKLSHFWKEESLIKCLNNYDDQILNIEKQMIDRVLTDTCIGIESYFKTINKIKDHRSKLSEFYKKHYL